MVSTDVETVERPVFVKIVTPYVLELASYECTTLSGFHVLEIDKLEQVAVNVEHHPVPEISCGCHGPPDADFLLANR